MADQILYARVKQKKATEAVWLANPLILLDGEVAYVVDPTDPGVVVNYKIGVGDKTFAQLPYVIHYAVDATYQAVKRYTAVTANQTITGIFKKGTILKRIPYLNTSAATLTIKIGTTAGGAEIGQFTFSDSAKVLDIEYLFESTSTVYITGVAGHLSTFFVEYTPYADSPVVPPTPPVSQFRYPKGHFGYFYVLYDGHLEENFDTATGLGLPDTGFANCALTGTNSIVDYSGAYVVGINTGASPQALTGNTDNLVTLGITNLPKFKMDLKINKDRYGLVGGGGAPRPYGPNTPGAGTDTLQSDEIGGDTPFNIQPKSIKMYSFVAISD